MNAARPVTQRWRPSIAEARRYTARARERRRATPHRDAVDRYLARTAPDRYGFLVRGGAWVVSSPAGTWVRVAD